MPELWTDIDDFMRRDLGFLGKTKPVLTTATAGPAVVVIHEVYGFTPTLARFCRWIRDGGFRVYAPVLFGSVDAGNPERILPSRLLGLCISREFYLFTAGKSSPVVEWFKELAQLAHRECGGRGVCHRNVSHRQFRLGHGRRARSARAGRRPARPAIAQSRGARCVGIGPCHGSQSH